MKSATITGIEAIIIEIEVDLKKGLPLQSIVGLPDPAVREARERVNAAIRNSGYDFPLGCLTVNLAPADLKKVGSFFDLAIAIGILIVSGQIEPEGSIDDFLFLGELSLDGSLRPVRGVIATVEMAGKANITKVVLPAQNKGEALHTDGLSVFPVTCLSDAVEVLCDPSKAVKAVVSTDVTSDPVPPNPGKSGDFAEVRGQNYAIRAVEIAAAGGHNLLFIGSPGSGKTMIATRMVTILPPMSEIESLETTKIYSVAGLLPAGGGLIELRPFRMPHHTASDVSITGGGRNPIPGEITLAHNGILYMDEFPEFRSSVIQALRQPLESGWITVARAESRLSYPARFMLVASMNPCPCGYLFDKNRSCRCTRKNINKYFLKLSGPIIDRIDIQVVVKPLKAFEIVEGKPAHSSESIRARVVEAQRIQRSRYRGNGNFLNASMDLDHIKRFCVTGRSVRNLLYDAVQRLRLSARSYYRILRVARTVADLDGRDQLCEEDVLEVLCYREVERILYGETPDGTDSDGPGKPVS